MVKTPTRHASYKFPYLFDRDRGFPTLLFVKNGEAHRAGWIYVRMEQRWRELA